MAYFDRAPFQSRIFQEVAETYCDRLWRCDVDDAQDIYGLWVSVKILDRHHRSLAGYFRLFGRGIREEKGRQCSIRWASCDEIEDVELDEYGRRIGISRVFTLSNTEDFNRH